MLNNDNHEHQTSDAKKGLKRILGNCRGIALVSVLWVLVLLTAIIGEFAYSMRTEVNITRNFKEATQAYYIAHSGLIRSVVEMIRNTAATNRENEYDTPEEITWRVNVTIPPEKFGSGEFSVHIDNSAGLIDLNAAGEALLGLMVNTLDINDDEKSVIVHSILDWRDSDDFHRLNGAENRYYQSLPNPYACKNGPFDSVEELLLVRGVTTALFEEKLKSIVTVLPGNQPTRTATGQININAAPRRLLEALPQITPQQVQTLIDYRTYRDFISFAEIRDLIGGETFSAISPYLTLALSPYYKVRSEGRVTAGAAKQIIQAMVKIDPGLPAGYQFVSWQDQYY